ncbi:MAG: MerR family transcriptional regulator [Butyricicoccaceae bacterium]
MTIAEVSKKMEISADTLRYYERVGLIPPVKRTSGGIRNYDETDCNWILFIKCMRGAGLPIETLVEYVALFRQGNSTIAARKELLIEQRQALAERIAAMQEVLGRLDAKIDGYEECLRAEARLIRPEQP